MVMVPPRMAQKPMGISRRDMGRPERAEMRLTTGRNRAAAPTFCMKQEMTPTVPEMIGMMRVSVVPPILQDKGGDLAHDAGLVQPGADDHHGDDRHDRVLAKPSNRCSVAHQPLLQPHPGREQRGQPQQHHDGDGGHVHTDHLEGEQIDGQQQENTHVGNFLARNDGRQPKRQPRKSGRR